MHYFAEMMLSWKLHKCWRRLSAYSSLVETTLPSPMVAPSRVRSTSYSHSWVLRTENLFFTIRQRRQRKRRMIDVTTSMWARSCLTLTKSLQPTMIPTCSRWWRKLNKRDYLRSSNPVGLIMMILLTQTNCLMWTPMPAHNKQPQEARQAKRT